MFFFLLVTTLLQLFATAQITSILPSSISHCNISTFHNGGKVNGPIYIDTSPLTPFESPRLSAINSTAWEQWYFDSASSTGKSNMVMTFFRDPTMDPAHVNTLFVMLDNVWDNGTRTSTITYTKQATIYQCSDATYGIWNGSLDTSDTTNFIFKVSKDLKTSTLAIHTPDTYGNWSIKSMGPARYPDGSLQPKATSSLLFSPYTWWDEAIPGGTVTATLNVKNTPFILSGTGGVDYFAGSFIWNYITTNWYWIRANIGPYYIVIWQFGSANDHKQHFSAFLVQKGAVVFKTQTLTSTVPSTFTGPHASVSLLYGGITHGSFTNNTATGFAVDMTLGPGQKRWHFEFEHQNIGFEGGVQTGTEQFTRFVDKTRGGLVGGTVYTGQGNSEQMSITVNAAIP